MVNQVPTEADYDVAVPGESLTGELGNKPYEQPGKCKLLYGTNLKPPDYASDCC